MATKLTESYVDDHIGMIDKSAHEVGQRLSYLILREVKEQLTSKGSAESLKIDATVTVKANEAVCLDVTVCLPIVGCATVHIGV